MDLISFISSLNGEFIKNKLIENGVDASKLQGVNFNDINQLNKLAEDIMPGLIKANPNIANMIKQNSNMLPKEKQDDVVQVIEAV